MAVVCCVQAMHQNQLAPANKTSDFGDAEHYEALQETMHMLHYKQHGLHHKTPRGRPVVRDRATGSKDGQRCAPDNQPMDEHDSMQMYHKSMQICSSNVQLHSHDASERRSVS